MRSDQALGIVLKRVNYGEADRIITFITDSHGKISVMAKGVRKEKSKLAGGIELFSISHLSFIVGKRDVGTLVSTRLKKHFKHIVSDIDRTNLAYEILKKIDKTTEENCERDYFDLLENTLAALDDTSLPLDLVSSWFMLRLLVLLGHAPNLTSDQTGKKLAPAVRYDFDYDHMAFFAHDKGTYSDKHIKLLRLIRVNSAQKTAAISGVDKLAQACNLLLMRIINQQT